MKPKDEDGYVDDWQIRKYSDCHPSSAKRVYTREEVLKEIDGLKDRINKDIIKLSPANDYEEGIRLNLIGVISFIEEFKSKFEEK